MHLTRIIDYAVELAKYHDILVKWIIETDDKCSFPESGFETIKDQFMLGDEILVTPVLEKGARSRTVVFPEGKWKGDDGSMITGGKTIEIEVPLERLPYFRLLL